MKEQQIFIPDFETIDVIEKLREQSGLSKEFSIAAPIDTTISIAGKKDRTATNFNEKQIHTWDLVDINYLQKGYIVSRSVCKLYSRDTDGPFTGTGFMISNRLLITNNHNLPTEQIARKAFVEFDHELGADGFPKDQQRFILKPEEAFWTDADLDVTIVAVARLSRSNSKLSDYGFLSLDPEEGKIEKDNFISIIHHPNGELKQVAIRENRLIEKKEKVLMYASDTSSGSSGAPCFSDKWQVVAIHRRGIPKTNKEDSSLIALKNGEFMTWKSIKALRILESDIIWMANEGTRVSVLLKVLKKDKSALKYSLIVDWMDNLGPINFENSDMFSSNISNTVIRNFIENRRADKNYEKRNGYQKDFLGIQIPVPCIERAQEKWGSTSFNSDTGKAEFTYYNYSLWMSKERRMTFLTAVNIDGKNHNQRERKEFGGDKWEYDSRLPERLQIGDWFYGNEPARYNKNYFDRGHVVRRTEPTWGPTESAQLANDDTFHWTNCLPQYKYFNQNSRHWQGIEVYLLDEGAIEHNLRMTIFAGPIFSSDDIEHRGVLIPKRFFKIAVFIGINEKLVSAGYVLDQSEWVEVLDFEKAYKLDVASVRRSIKSIEDETGINFGAAIREADAANDFTNDLNKIKKLPDLFSEFAISS